MAEQDWKRTVDTAAWWAARNAGDDPTAPILAKASVILAADAALREAGLLAESRNKKVAYLAKELEESEAEGDRWEDETRDLITRLADAEERLGLQENLTDIWQERAHQLEQHIVSQGGEIPPMLQDDEFRLGTDESAIALLNGEQGKALDEVLPPIVGVVSSFILTRSPLEVDADAQS